MVKSVAGLGQPETLYKSPKPTVCGVWSRDGKWLFCSELETGANNPVYTNFALAIGGGGKRVPVTPPPFGGSIRAASPDANFVAYYSTESGQQELYVRTFSPDSPTAGGKWQISNGLSRLFLGATWRADGKEILYVDTKNQMVAVPVQASGTSFQAGAPVPLFEVKGPIEVRADGQRFLATITTGERESPAENIVINWMATLPGRR